MDRLMGLLVLAVVGLTVLVAVGPALVALLHSAIPFVLAVGFVLVLVRAVWWLTGRW